MCYQDEIGTKCTLFRTSGDKKNIALLFYLCGIVHKDVIWLLKPFALHLKAKADNSNKRLSLSPRFVI